MAGYEANGFRVSKGSSGQLCRPHLEAIPNGLSLLHHAPIPKVQSRTNRKVTSLEDFAVELPLHIHKGELRGCLMDRMNGPHKNSPMDHRNTLAVIPASRQRGFFRIMFSPVHPQANPTRTTLQLEHTAMRARRRQKICPGSLGV